jgi:hypothetical protein
MIEKLKVYEETPSGYKHLENIIQDKINEIIDLLNAIVVDVDGTKCIDGSKAPTDPYAEQRKWIGCLCRFWFDNKKQADIGILGDIDEDEIHPYFNADLGHNYKCCEPVKPDDDIVYKRE